MGGRGRCWRPLAAALLCGLTAVVVADSPPFMGELPEDLNLEEFDIETLQMLSTMHDASDLERLFEMAASPSGEVESYSVGGAFEGPSGPLEDPRVGASGPPGHLLVSGGPHHSVWASRGPGAGVRGPPGPPGPMNHPMALAPPSAGGTLRRKPVLPMELREPASEPKIIDGINAVCSPELRSVELDIPEEPGVLVFPRCVRLQRCGGCCQGSRLQCQPTSTANVTVRVKKFSMRRSVRSARLEKRGGSRGGSRGRRRRTPTARLLEVPAVQHTACGCQCRVRQCSPLHYLSQCACHCKDRMAEEQCKGLKSHHWDTSSCACLCNTEASCSTTQAFNHSTCRCETLVEELHSSRSAPYAEFAMAPGLRIVEESLFG